jgi:cytochrome c biogenesis protein CcmG/thiol:disulfide interchange protein DsbE
MKYVLTFAFVCITLFSFGQKEVPDVTLRTLDGKKVQLKEYAENGKITVISFWATWCGPCRKELDAIADIYPDWQADYDMELVAITLDTRRQMSKVPGVVETHGWEYDILSGDLNMMQNTFNFQAPPYTLVLDKNGKIAYTHNGYNPGDEYELEEKLKKIAGK